MKRVLAFAIFSLLATCCFGQETAKEWHNECVSSKNLYVRMGWISEPDLGPDVPTVVMSKLLRSQSASTQVFVVNLISCAIAVPLNDCQQLDIVNPERVQIGTFRNCSLVIDNVEIGRAKPRLAKQIFSEPLARSPQATKYAACERRLAAHQKSGTIRKIQEFNDSNPNVVVGPKFDLLMLEQKEAVLSDVSCVISYAAPDRCADFSLTEPFNGRWIGSFQSCKLELR